jgi:spore germination protein YaaH
MKKILLFFVPLVLLLGVSAWLLRKNLHLPNLHTPSPFHELKFELETVDTNNQSYSLPKVIGFLPYWFVDNVETLPAGIDELSYFNFQVTAQGDITEEQRPNSSLEQKKQRVTAVVQQYPEVTEKKVRLTLVFTNFSSADITNLMASQTAQQNFFQQIQEYLTIEEVAGIVIDFEPEVRVEPQVRENFSKFMAELREVLNKKSTLLTLSIALYPSGITGENLWDVSTLAPVTSSFIIMSYDFHQKSSPQAGALAPLYSERNKDTHILFFLREFVLQVPRKKIILGIPLYGYRWQTTDPQPYANTFPRSGQTFQPAELPTATGSPELVWDEESFSHFVTNSIQDTSFVNTFESDISLQYKLHYVRELQLGGVALWSLGYQPLHPSFWDQLSSE